MVCSVLLTACSGNGAYVNSVSLEPTFEPSVRPSARRPPAPAWRWSPTTPGGGGGRGEAAAAGSAQRRMGARTTARRRWMVFGNVECSVLGGVGGGARGFYMVLEQFPS